MLARERRGNFLFCIRAFLQRLQTKPKFHLFSEMGEYQSAELGNPRHFWAYADESFVGFVSTLAASRGGGHTASTLPERTIARYRIMNAM